MKIPLSSTALGGAIVLVLLLAIISWTSFFNTNSIESGAASISHGETADLLPDGSGITGWSLLDRDSIHVSGMVNYTITVLFDPARVTPDLDIFERSIDVLPLEKRRITEKQFHLRNGTSRYVIEYTLQAVNVALNTRYRLDPVTVYYTSQGTPELLSHEIPSPVIHIIDYYPADISGVSLRPLKGRIITYTTVERVLTAMAGMIMLLLAVYTIFKLCIYKPAAELTKYERLWLEFRRRNNAIDDDRERFSSAEKVFSRLLALEFNINPSRFWSGKAPDDTFWQDKIEKARALLRKIYQSAGPDEKDENEMEQLLDESFSRLLTEQQRETIEQPTFIRRCMAQKKPMTICISGLLLGSILTIKAVLPELWIEDEIIHYNTLIEMAGNTQVTDEMIEGFSELGQVLESDPHRAASYYNSATLLADSLQVITMDQALTVGDVFANVGINERIIQDAEDLLEVLTTNVDSYRQSELLLREAVRADPVDENIARNLEIVTKRRKGALNIIRALIDTGDIQQVEVEELLNLLESQMALDFEMEEGKEAPGYYIGEEF